MRHPIDPIPTNRRDFLQTLGGGFGAIALAAMSAEQAAAAPSPQSEVPNPQSSDPLAPRAPHYPPRAKRVILLWMQGGPSQMDLFDYKPRLVKEAGEKIPFTLTESMVTLAVPPLGSTGATQATP